MTEQIHAEEPWMVLAIIQPFRLDAVTLALEQLPQLGGMTISACRGFGRGKRSPEEGVGDAFQTVETLIDFTDKMRIEVVVAGREVADRVVSTIARVAHTGRPGDGKVFAWPLARTLRIRTGQEGVEAL